MIKMITRLFGLFLLLPSLVFAAGDFVEGKDYIRLAKPVATSGSNVEVAEAFWYGCPHCFSLEPAIKSWVKKLPDDVSFRKVPAMFGKEWKVHGQLFYTARALKLGAQVDYDIFNEIHVQNNRLNNPDAMAKFLAVYGVSKGDFEKAYSSFGVKKDMQKANAVVRGSKLTGVPAFIVNGKYRVSAREAGSNARMLEVVAYLAERERQAN